MPSKITIYCDICEKEISEKYFYLNPILASKEDDFFSHSIFPRIYICLKCASKIKTLKEPPVSSIGGIGTKPIFTTNY